MMFAWEKWVSAMNQVFFIALGSVNFALPRYDQNRFRPSRRLTVAVFRSCDRSNRFSASVDQNRRKYEFRNRFSRLLSFLNQISWIVIVFRPKSVKDMKLGAIRSIRSAAQCCGFRIVTSYFSPIAW
jgi:hypothetical protein